MLVIDTSTLPRQERAEAFQASVSVNCTASAAEFEDPADVTAQVHVHHLGAAKVLTIDASGTTLRRTPQMARAGTESSIALALPVRATNHMEWEREDRAYGPRDLLLVDLAAPYVYRWPHGGASYALHVEQGDLDLPMDLVRTAARQLTSSPLYALVRDHVASVTAHAPELARSAAAASVGAASVELVRALVVSAAGDARRSDEAMHHSLAARVEAYVTRHLREGDLGPARIAAAHGISVRALYALYEARGVSLEQSVILQRLRGAQADLASPGTAHRTIAAVARSWGFSNPSFFSSRFRTAFGVTPRQWRATAGGPAQAALRSIPRPRASSDADAHG